MGLQDSEASKGTHEPGGDFVLGAPSNVAQNNELSVQGEQAA